MDEKEAKLLLSKIQNDYNLIAEDFARKRSFLSPDIKFLADFAKEGEKILDSGCGNGRLFLALKEKNVDYYGVDFSEKLIEIAKKNYPEGKFLVANCLNLPFPENFFDKVYSIAVLHHIPSKKFRILYLKEIKRVLKKNGIFFLRVWDFWKRKGFWKILLKHTLLKLVGKSKLDFFDVFIPWKDSKGKILIQRYFHCFTEKELKKLLKITGFQIIKIWSQGKDKKANIYLISKKP
jgi:ubiquinone/menaquinone biosynthesis C-methylase UbiE